MTAPANRRGFLRGLVTLPLIGGGVTLIGAPTAVAEPVTAPLRARYLAWLAREFTEALVERERIELEQHVAASLASGHAFSPEYLPMTVARRRANLAYLTEPLLIRGCPPIPATPPSTRAALVLSAVGCDWRGGAA